MSKKRNATTPQGGLVKDPRTSITGDQDGEWINVNSGRGRGRGQGNRGREMDNTCEMGGGGDGNADSRVVSPRPAHDQDRDQRDQLMQAANVSQKDHTRADTYASRTRGGSSRKPNQDQRERRQSVSSSDLTGTDRAFNMGDKSFFVTPRPDGALRDDLIVQCQTINGKPFRGTVTLKEAKLDIFEGKLGYNRTLLHSIRTSFNGCPVIKFKLNQQVNVDDLISVEYFDLERRYMRGKETITDVIQCRVMGIRNIQSVGHLGSSENDVRWVKIEGCEYTLEDKQILEWLQLYGEILSPICEDIHEDSDSEAEPIGNGTYSVKMRLVKDIPQFLPMYGRRIRIYYKGINKICTQCFGSHNRRQCQNGKTPWIVYVRDYMTGNKDVGEMMYGKWWNIIDKEFPGYFDIQQDQMENGNTLSDESLPSFPQSEVREQDNQSETIDTSHQQARTQSSRQSRDPRVYSRKNEGDTSQQHQKSGIDIDLQQQREMSDLVARGLTLEDAKSYMKSRREQAEMEKKMEQLLSPNLNARASGTGQNYSRGGGTAH